MNTREYEKLKMFNDIHDDLPDGAFYALAEEQGIDIYDWVEFCEEQKKDPDYNQPNPLTKLIK